MSTIVEIDDELVRRAVDQSGLASVREAIEEALRVFIRLQVQEGVGRGVRQVSGGDESGMKGAVTVTRAAVEVDDDLLAKAQELGVLDETAAVEESLRALIRVRRQGQLLREMFGKFEIDPTAARDLCHKCRSLL